MKTTMLALATIISFGTVSFAETDAFLNPPEKTANKLYQVSGNWSELKVGWNTLNLEIADVNQSAVTGAQVEVDYDMVGMPMSPPKKPVEEKGSGKYEKQVFLGMGGTWKFDIKVTKNAVSDTLSKEVEVTQ